MQSLRDDFFALFRDVNKGDWQALFGARDQILLARVQFSCRDGTWTAKSGVEPVCLMIEPPTT